MRMGNRRKKAAPLYSAISGDDQPRRSADCKQRDDGISLDLAIELASVHYFPSRTRGYPGSHNGPCLFIP